MPLDLPSLELGVPIVVVRCHGDLPISLSLISPWSTRWGGDRAGRPRGEPSRAHPGVGPLGVPRGAARIPDEGGSRGGAAARSAILRMPGRTPHGARCPARPPQGSSRRPPSPGNARGSLRLQPRARPAAAVHPPPATRGGGLAADTLPRQAGVGIRNQPKRSWRAREGCRVTLPPASARCCA